MKKNIPKESIQIIKIQRVPYKDIHHSFIQAIQTFKYLILNVYWASTDMMPKNTHQIHNYSSDMSVKDKWMGFEH